MFLQPSEVGFLKHLKEARVPLVEFEFPAKRIVNIQSQLEKLIGQNYYLNKVSSSREISTPRWAVLTSKFAVGEGWLPLLPPSVRFPQPSLSL